MVFITLVSQIPFLNVKCDEDLILKNKINIGLGFMLYIILGGLIYMNKIPNKILSIISDTRYLGFVLIIDIILYIVIYRFTYGFLPPLSKSMIPKINQINNQINNSNQNDHINQVKMNIKNQSIQNQKNNEYKSNIKKNKKNVTFEQSVNKKDEEISVNLEDDLESSLKRPTKNKILDFPDEVSVPGKNYFKDDEGKAIIENWDIDEFGDDEYISN